MKLNNGTRLFRVYHLSCKYVFMQLYFSGLCFGPPWVVKNRNRGFSGGSMARMVTVKGMGDLNKKHAGFCPLWAADLLLPQVHGPKNPAFPWPVFFFLTPLIPFM